MSKLKIVFILLMFAHSFQMFCQSGVYIREPQNTDGNKMKWTLSLNEDGTFLYRFYRDLAGEGNPEENYYGKGTWELEGIIMSFYSEISGLDERFSVNLNKSKARYISKSPRDKSNKVIRTALRFYESEAFAIRGLELFKK